MPAPTCTGGTVSCWIASQVDILTNVANTLAPVEKLITGWAYIMGLAFVVKAIYTLKMYGESRSFSSGNTNLKEPLIYALVGGVFLYLPTAFSAMLQTTFGYSNVLQYAPVSSSNSALDTLFGNGSLVGRPLAMVIQVIGLFAFIRGWVLLARSASHGQQPGGTGKGLIHIFGGIFAINIVGTINIINNTLFGS